MHVYEFYHITIVPRVLQLVLFKLLLLRVEQQIEGGNEKNRMEYGVRDVVIGRKEYGVREIVIGSRSGCRLCCICLS